VTAVRYNVAEDKGKIDQRFLHRGCRLTGRLEIIQSDRKIDQQSANNNWRQDSPEKDPG
jgi:hypothetical protein